MGGDGTINTNGEKLNHHRFADDIVLIADSIDVETLMLETLFLASEKVGLKINMIKNRAHSYTKKDSLTEKIIIFLHYGTL